MSLDATILPGLVNLRWNFASQHSQQVSCLESSASLTWLNVTEQGRIPGTSANLVALSCWKASRAASCSAGSSSCRRSAGPKDVRVSEAASSIIVTSAATPAFSPMHTCTISHSICERPSTHPGSHTHSDSFRILLHGMFNTWSPQIVQDLIVLLHGCSICTVQAAFGHRCDCRPPARAAVSFPSSCWRESACAHRQRSFSASSCLCSPVLAAACSRSGSSLQKGTVQSHFTAFAANSSLRGTFLWM